MHDDIPAFRPRTSSLHPASDQSSSPLRDHHQHRIASDHVAVNTKGPSGDVMRSAVPSMPPSSPISTGDTTSHKDVSAGDSERNASEAELLALLEQENAQLRCDPKSVLVEQGVFMVDLTTLQTLTQDHTRASTPLDEEEIQFWNSIIEERDAATTANGSNHSISKISSLLIAKIRRGIPPQLRSRIWMIMSGAKPKTLEHIYTNLLEEESSSERIIKRDIPRTFPKLDMFKDEDGPGQRSLFNLLKAYSVYDRDCGYCQGLSFVVAPLLLQNMPELDAFAVFVRLMDDPPSRPGNIRTFGLRSLFTPQMPGLHLLLYQHSELVRLYLPRLYGHFVQNSIMADTYASPWFLTLFTYNFPLPLVFRIFDIIFAEGATETMLRFSIGILKRNQDNLLQKSDLEGILEYLKGGNLYKIYNDDPERVVQDAMELDSVITTALLDKIKDNFLYEKNGRRHSELEVKQIRWEAQRLTAENLQLSHEISTLRECLKQAEERRIRDLKALNTEFEVAMEKWQVERRELIRSLQNRN